MFSLDGIWGRMFCQCRSTVQLRLTHLTESLSLARCCKLTSARTRLIFVDASVMPNMTVSRQRFHRVQASFGSFAPVEQLVSRKNSRVDAKRLQDEQRNALRADSRSNFPVISHRSLPVAENNQSRSHENPPNSDCSRQHPLLVSCGPCCILAHRSFVGFETRFQEKVVKASIKVGVRHFVELWA